MLEEQEKHKQAKTAETAYAFFIACCGNESRCRNKGGRISDDNIKRNYKDVRLWWSVTSHSIASCCIVIPQNETEYNCDPHGTKILPALWGKLDEWIFIVGHFRYFRSMLSVHNLERKPRTKDLNALVTSFFADIQSRLGYAWRAREAQTGQNCRDSLCILHRVLWKRKEM